MPDKTPPMSALAQKPSPAPWQFFAAHRSLALPFFVDRSEGPSFAGSRPREIFVVDRDAGIRCWRGGAWQSLDGDPIRLLGDFVARSCARAIALPDWLREVCLPRTVGYLSYELGAWADAPPCLMARRKPGSAAMPLAVLCTYDGVDAWNPLEASTARIRFEDCADAVEAPALAAVDLSAWVATTRGEYQRGFARIRDAIGAGDIYQANLSRRALFDLDESAAAAYERLRTLQPVPWGAFLDYGGFALLSNSPECFLRRRGDSLRTRPIKGTRARSADPGRDAAQRAALLQDPKELAEHLMIVDLERNDLGRIARTGSVRVERLAALESFATLHHLVSDVCASARDGVGLAALLRATFPGGSITGAPKLRAMEILDEVEATGRGPYTGAIGFFNGESEVELSIAIRTAVASGGRALYSTGGGIVADSDADREWNETEVKLAAFRAALETGRQLAQARRNDARPDATIPGQNNSAGART